MDDEEKESTWGDILRALKAVDKSGFGPLHHVAGVTYLMKRHHHQPVAEEHEEFVVRKLEGPQQVAPLSGRSSNEGPRKKLRPSIGQVSTSADRQTINRFQSIVPYFNICSLPDL